ncbi:hypothetical protein [Rugamonas rubra]|uniref:hypothetical protein n=1 Tax=Rugamonas rubra TaxID=758825 RepID=UPI000B8507AE|nr:hypothetical protein [Rugamonas rubra]
MSFLSDIAVYSADRQLQLVVEIKGMPSSDEQWAAQFRRNLLTHYAVPPAPFFLLVLPDQLYLWTAKHGETSALPDYHAKTWSALKRYLPHAQQGAISKRGLELAVQSWLSDLTNSDDATKANGAEPRWLADSGLSEAIRTGSMQVEAMV